MPRAALTSWNKNNLRGRWEYAVRSECENAEAPVLVLLLGLLRELFVSGA